MTDLETKLAETLRRLLARNLELARLGWARPERAEADAADTLAAYDAAKAAK